MKDKMEKIMRIQHNKKATTVQYETRIRDMAFQVQFFLQMCEGSNLVRAIGFPHAKTNDMAVQLWIRRNNIDYYKLEPTERIQKMATGLFNQMFEYQQYGKHSRVC